MILSSEMGGYLLLLLMLFVHFTAPCWPAALLTLVMVLSRRRQSSFPFRASVRKQGHRVMLLVVVVAWILGLAGSTALLMRGIHIDF